MKTTYSIEKARALWKIRTNATVPTCPLRFRPVIIAAEEDNRYYVTTLGFAVANGFEPVQ
jgi:hypothetical protein